MIRQGVGEPLVLLHPLAGSERAWRRVVPLLAAHHDTIALNALGHRGGRAWNRSAVLRDLVDDVEAQLDRLGLDRPHLAGNSMGGWLSLELARRGRAQTVCALSPGGCWDVASAAHRRSMNGVRRQFRRAERSRSLLPLVAGSATLRRIALRDSAEHGERLSAEELIDLVDDLRACAIWADVLDTPEQLGALDPLPCPVLLAWAECDRVFPPALNGAYARRLMPGATWRKLPGVGHVPMIDAPELVASAILEATGALEAAHPVMTPATPTQRRSG